MFGVRYCKEGRSAMEKGPMTDEYWIYGQPGEPMHTVRDRQTHMQRDTHTEIDIHSERETQTL